MMPDDDTVECPSCGYAHRVSEIHCQNPACGSNPSVSPDVLRKLASDHQAAVRQRREDDARRRLWGESFIRRSR